MSSRLAPGGWRPGVELSLLKLRARLLGEIRVFFAARGVLEVETPVLARSAATDPNLASLTTTYAGCVEGRGRALYLRTSPEHEMKRLVAAGSGPIFQICRCFRDGELGPRHNPEFMLVEWYRPGFALVEMMAEVAELVSTALFRGGAARPAAYLSYRRAFLERLGVDPLVAGPDALRRCADQHGVPMPEGMPDDRADPWLDLLLTHCIEPELGRAVPTFLYQYPISQAALARVSAEDSRVAERFELYVDGVELANGFDELTDSGEQRRRFQAENAERGRLGLEQMPVDEHLLAALADGLPQCAGVALGFDRLVMLAAGVSDIDESMAFAFERV